MKRLESSATALIATVVLTGGRSAGTHVRAAAFPLQ
jgi:hypothetical protein